MAKLTSNQFSILPSGMEQSEGFGDEPIEDEAVTSSTAIEDTKKRLSQLDSESNALMSVIKAQGDKPDTNILNRLSEIKQEKSSLEELVKASPVSPTAAPTPMTTPTPTTVTPSATGQKTLLGAIQASGTTPSPAPTEGMPTSMSTPVTAEAEAEKPEDTLLARLRKAEETRGEERKRADIGQVAEMVGKSLSQIGAAQQGMKAGVDLSGVGQAKGIDWTARRAEIADDYKTELASISKEREQLLEKEKRATEAGNQKALLDIKQKELKLSERETNAKIDKMKQDTQIAKAAAGKPDSKVVQATIETADKKLAPITKDFLSVEKLNTQINQNVKEAIEARRTGKSSAAAERAAITSYLKQLDPQSAVLAAEQSSFIEAGDREALLNALTSKNAGDLSSFVEDKVLGRMDASRLEGLRNAANSQFKVAKDAYASQIKPILRSAYEGGVTNPLQLLGRQPTAEEVDEVTAKAWGVSGPSKEPSTAPVPASKMPGVVSYKSADEFLKSRGK